MTRAKFRAGTNNSITWFATCIAPSSRPVTAADTDRGAHVSPALVGHPYRRNTSRHEQRTFADGRLEVRWKGQVLPYRVFDKDQRVSHAAIVENKRLGHPLAIIKAQQDLKYAPKLKTNSEKIDVFSCA
jgi:hypothetical protein